MEGFCRRFFVGGFSSFSVYSSLPFLSAVALLLVLSKAPTSLALKCVVCKDTRDPNCDRDSPRECPTEEHKYCAAIRFKSQNTRHELLCLTERERDFYEREYKLINYCRTDGCNAGYTARAEEATETTTKPPEKNMDAGLPSSSWSLSFPPSAASASSSWLSSTILSFVRHHEHSVWATVLTLASVLVGGRLVAVA